MKILITGAKGYIGSHLIQELEKDVSLEIFGVSRTKTDSEVRSEKKKYIYADLSSDNFTKELPDNIDVVIHLAQSSAYRDFPAMAEDIFNINVRSTQLLLDWSVKTGVKKFVFASTGNVYKQQNKLLNENDPCEPVGYYGASKYAAEQIIKPYNQFFETCILRIFGVYGPGQKKMTIPNIIEKIKNREEITLAGGKGLCFTPLYIDDCVEILMKLISNTRNPQICNLSGNEIIHLGNLIQIIGKTLDIKPLLKIIESKPMYLTGSNQKLVDEIAYTPKIKIERGIALTLNS